MRMFSNLYRGTRISSCLIQNRCSFTGQIRTFKASRYRFSSGLTAKDGETNEIEEENSENTDKKVSENSENVVEKNESLLDSEGNGKKWVEHSAPQKDDAFELIKTFIDEEYGDGKHEEIKESTPKKDDPFDDLIKSLDILEDFEVANPQSNKIFTESSFPSSKSKRHDNEVEFKKKFVKKDYADEKSYDDIDEWLQSLNLAESFETTSKESRNENSEATEIGYTESQKILSLLKDEQGFEAGDEFMGNSGKRGKSDEFFKGIFNSAFKSTVPSGRSQFQKLMGINEESTGPRYTYNGNDRFYKKDRRGDGRRSDDRYSYSDRINTILRKEFLDKVGSSLSPTKTYIESLESRSAVVDFLRSVIKRWVCTRDHIDTEVVSLQMKLTSALKEDKALSTIHEEYIASMAAEASENPKEPPLNVFTLPVVFNQVLKTLTFKHHDGQLALSLYNSLKNDINLYTVICNQQTYNEVLRLLPIYFGKSDLYSIEMAFMEMKNNGFSGDSVTFNILSQILNDYHSLNQEFSRNKNTTLSSYEDDKRAENLYRWLTTLQRNLRIEP
ncbi:uncharacterized protein RJT20DRAFT_128814 [Scheffersomyces xylosifermentans]|uniref:uncharacterized protein n=1 Tax=Scheffersomyces xylosifermentans TaxID=1304137 RepID=UPI00315C902C